MVKKTVGQEIKGSFPWYYVGPRGGGDTIIDAIVRRVARREARKLDAFVLEQLGGSGKPLVLNSSNIRKIFDDAIKKIRALNQNETYVIFPKEPNPDEPGIDPRLGFKLKKQ